MKLAETVTFGGSALDRAAELRADVDLLRDALASPDRAETIVLWRGKPAFAGEKRKALLRLAPDHPAFRDASEPPILLGREETGRLVFVRDVSNWAPEDAGETAQSAFFDSSEQCHPLIALEHGFAELRGVMSQLSPRDAELAATARAVLGWHRSHRFCAACGAESRMVMAGWQRTCDACGTHHFPRTDPVAIMLVTHGDDVLLGRSPGWPTGMYSCLAGFVEPGEPIEAAVRREVFEETQVRVGPVRYLSSQPWPYPSSLMFGCHGEALSREITIDPAEIEDARWFSRDELVEAFAGRHPTLKPARKGAIAHFLLWNWLADRLD
ncbi:NAD(+) diphosphatase [Rhodobacteraceae bacterium 63075]|nr:NAD(+) diphosphatase [Rhodobacteraceae bacterium 63075]